MKRCPHCGSNQLHMEKILLPTWDGLPRYVIVCKCSASGPKAESEGIARQQWNGRSRKKVVSAEEILQRWGTLAKKYQYLGIDLATECRSLGSREAYCNSSIGIVYADYVKLHKFICAEVDIINDKIKQLIPTLT